MTEDVENLHFYERQIKKTLCLIKECDLKSRRQVPQDVTADFDNKMPYNYMQLCYFKVRSTFTVKFWQGHFYQPLSVGQVLLRQFFFVVTLLFTPKPTRDLL